MHTHCDWLNKEADWLIAGKDKVRQENQTKDTEKGRVRRVARKTQRGNRMCK